MPKYPTKTITKTIKSSKKHSLPWLIALASLLIEGYKKFTNKKKARHYNKHLVHK